MFLQLKRRKLHRFLATTLSTGCVFATLVGCEREGVRAYRVAKEKHVENHPSQQTQSNTKQQAAKVLWTVPNGWEQLDKVVSMRFATFMTPSGIEVTLAVFPGDVGGLLANVNRWRGQVGLSSIPEAELYEYAKQIEGTNSYVVDAIGPDASLIGTVINIGDGKTWFAKSVGQPDAVADAREDIISFSTSFHIEQEHDTQTQEENTSTWSQPTGWIVDENASPILMAAYDTDSGARVTLTSLGEDGGGLLGNINRWRTQVGLEPAQSLDEIELKTLQNGIVVVDLISTDGSQRIVSGVVPHVSETLFFKLTGTKESVEPELRRFAEFIIGVGLPHGERE